MTYGRRLVRCPVPKLSIAHLYLLFQQPITQLRKLLTHFKMSTHASGKLSNARKTLGIARGLQSIGNMRFATLYYAAVSVLNNLPALYKIYHDGEIDTKGTPLPDVSYC